MRTLFDFSKSMRISVSADTGAQASTGLSFQFGGHSRPLCNWAIDRIAMCLCALCAQEQSSAKDHGGRHLDVGHVSLFSRRLPGANSGHLFQRVLIWINAAGSIKCDRNRKHQPWEADATATRMGGRLYSTLDGLHAAGRSANRAMSNRRSSVQMSKFHPTVHIESKERRCTAF